MLYDCWRRIVRSRPAEVALDDFGTGRRWTFAELDAWAEDGSTTEGPVAFPVSGSAEFVAAVLRAWRRGQVICPLEPGQLQPPVHGPLPPEVAHLKTTSATTGPPRLVAFTAAQIAADARNIVNTMGLRPEWPNLAAISLAHSYGFSNLVTPLLLHGIPLILVGSTLPESIRRAAESREAITLPAVPALWRAWHESGAIPGDVKLGISAGAPLSLCLERAIFEATGIKVHNFYGSSECGGIAFDSTPAPRQDPGCVGAPLHEVAVTLGDQGCVEVASQAVGLGYWPEPSPALADGRFRAGDLGELRDGMVFLRGRLTDQINVAGRKISPETIERAILTHRGVRESLVFSVPSPDPARGETIVAALSLGAGVKLEDVRQSTQDLLPAWQLPRDWWLQDSLEVNHRGKVSRADWRRRYLEENPPTAPAKGPG